MAKKYINISNATTELLASTMKQTDGNVKSINIANTHNTITVSIGLYLESLVTSTDDFYFFKNVSLPPGVSLFLDKDLSFDISKYKLKLSSGISSGTSYLTVIIT